MPVHVYVLAHSSFVNQHFLHVRQLVSELYSNAEYVLRQFIGYFSCLSIFFIKIFSLFRRAKYSLTFYNYVSLNVGGYCLDSVCIIIQFSCMTVYGSNVLLGSQTPFHTVILPFTQSMCTSHDFIDD